MLFAIYNHYAYAYSGKSFDVVSFPDPLPLRFKFSLAELGMGTRLIYVRALHCIYRSDCTIVMGILGIHGHQYLALYRALVMEIDNKCPLTTDRVRGRFCAESH